ncbi:MAG: ABC transporter substrate-binding protein, partial [Bacteroidota bacterium]
MGRTRFRSVGLLLAVFLTFVSTAVTVLAQSSASSPATITLYLHQRDVPTMNWFKDTAKRFEESHPGIKVEIITSAGSGYLTKLTTLWATGMPPDVWGQAGTGHGWQKEGWLLDLTPYVQKDLAELDVKDFLPFAWQSAQWDGKVWGLPAISTAPPVFYNADMFEERGVVVPPHVWSDKGWTWQDM